MRYFFMAMLGCLGFARADGAWTAGERTELGTLPGDAIAWQQVVTGPGGTVRVTGVSFAAGKAGFRVVDNPPEARTAFPGNLIAVGAFAGINGGYFHPDYRPLGLMVAGGKEIHSFEKAKLLSGILVVRGGKIELVRAGSFKPGKDIQEALQAGPWLLEHGKTIVGLNTERKARRSVVATDGRGHWALIATGPLTLAETGEVLSLTGLPGGWTIRDALNLDGGSSTALWAATQPKPFEIFSFGTVRNYLAIVPRQK